MTETSLPSDPSDGSDTGDSSREEAQLSGPGAGLSATGRTAADFEPGEAVGSDYGDPGGIDTAVNQELAGDREDDVN
jgi:hypothetical protein